MNRRLGVLVLLITGLLTVLFAGSAQAHSRLTAADPADGATVPALPAEVVLTFNEDVSSLGLETKLSGPTTVTSTPVAEGTKVRVALSGDQKPGDYTLAYRVISADGHPIAGQLRYSVTEGTAPTATAAPEPTDSSTSGVTSTTTLAPPVTKAATSADTNAEKASSAISPTVIAALLAAVVVVGGVVLAVMANRRRKR